MARSREGRARQAARRNKYADEVLGRMADRTHHHTVKGMVWDVELAAALPNDLSDSERATFKALYAESPMKSSVYLDRLMARGEHMPEAGKIVQPRAGRKGPVVRMDTRIVPSWEQKDTRGTWVDDEA